MWSSPLRPPCSIASATVRRTRSFSQRRRVLARLPWPVGRRQWLRIDCRASVVEHVSCDRAVKLYCNRHEFASNAAVQGVSGIDVASDGPAVQSVSSAVSCRAQASRRRQDASLEVASIAVCLAIFGFEYRLAVSADFCRLAPARFAGCRPTCNWAHSVSAARSSARADVAAGRKDQHAGSPAPAGSHERQLAGGRRRANPETAGTPRAMRACTSPATAASGERLTKVCIGAGRSAGHASTLIAA